MAEGIIPPKTDSKIKNFVRHPAALEALLGTSYTTVYVADALNSYLRQVPSIFNKNPIDNLPLIVFSILLAADGLYAIIRRKNSYLTKGMLELTKLAFKPFSRYSNVAREISSVKIE